MDEPNYYKCQIYGVRVYEWADGWTCYARPDFHDGDPNTAIEFTFFPPGRDEPFLDESSPARLEITSMKRHQKPKIAALRNLVEFLEKNVSVSSKILGFLLDMNAPRVEDGTGRTIFFTSMFIPRFIDDEVLEELIEALSKATPPKNDEGPVEVDFKVQDLYFQARRFYGYIRISINGKTIRRDVETGEPHSAVVRDALRGWGLLPESEREEWVKENVQMGNPVGITRDEVSLFEALGEPIPIWDPDTASRFLEEVALRE